MLSSPTSTRLSTLAPSSVPMVRAPYPRRAAALADAVVQGNHVQHVEQLALVLVDAFDVHVEQAVGIGLHAQLALNEVGEPLLIGALNGGEFRAERGIGGIRCKLPQLVEVLG